jgi:hypothetical protein
MMKKKGSFKIDKQKLINKGLMYLAGLSTLVALICVILFYTPGENTVASILKQIDPVASQYKTGTDSLSPKYINGRLITDANGNSIGNPNGNSSLASSEGPAASTSPTVDNMALSTEGDPSNTTATEGTTDQVSSTDNSGNSSGSDNPTSNSTPSSDNSGGSTGTDGSSSGTNSIAGNTGGNSPDSGNSGSGNAGNTTDSSNPTNGNSTTTNSGSGDSASYERWKSACFGGASGHCYNEGNWKDWR